MRFLMIVKASKESEAGVMPSEQDMADMAKYNEQLVEAGAMLDAVGLHPSREGVRINFDSGTPHVIDGPFAESKELIAGYWLVQFKTREECIEWAKRVPFKEGELEVRPVGELEEFTQAVERRRKLQESMKTS